MRLDKKNIDLVEMLVAGQDLDLGPFGVNLEDRARREFRSIEELYLVRVFEILRDVRPPNIVTKRALGVRVLTLEKARRFPRPRVHDRSLLHFDRQPFEVRPKRFGRHRMRLEREHLGVCPPHQSEP